MKRIIVNGHGWSGSSAFIDLLNSYTNYKYCVIPGEYDDFRCPGTMRNAFENNILPVSKRTSNRKFLLSLFVRSLIDDKFWPNKIRGKNITKKKALKLFQNYYYERKIFNKYAKLIQKSDNKSNKEKLLRLWFNNVINYYKKINPKADNIFIEQFFLFDDESAIYEWLEFDKLILFIRDPYFQLASTLESKILYTNYPWQAQFLIGGGSKFNKRKFELFLETTELRYLWIINFLKRLKKNQIIIIDFDDFLNNFDQTIKFISKELEIDLYSRKNLFNISNSQERNRKWNSKIHNLDYKLNEVKKSYDLFKLELYSQYKNINNFND